MNNAPNLFVEFFLSVPCTHEIDHAREEDSFGSQLPATHGLPKCHGMIEKNPE